MIGCSWTSIDISTGKCVCTEAVNELMRNMVGQGPCIVQIAEKMAGKAMLSQ